MVNKNDNLVQSLYDARKNENRRVHDEYINAMELRTCDISETKQIIQTILSDFPEDSQVLPHNAD
jgi:hypothetical protein